MTNLFDLVAKQPKEQEMQHHVVAKLIRADQQVLMTVVELTGMTAQPQIENPIRLIEQAGASISLATFLKTLMGNCNNTTDRRQKTENT